MKKMISLILIVLPLTFLTGCFKSETHLTQDEIKDQIYFEKNTVSNKQIAIFDNIKAINNQYIEKGEIEKLRDCNITSYAYVYFDELEIRDLDKNKIRNKNYITANSMQTINGVSNGLFLVYSSQENKIMDKNGNEVNKGDKIIVYKANITNKVLYGSEPIIYIEKNDIEILTPEIKKKIEAKRVEEKEQAEKIKKQEEEIKRQEQESNIKKLKEESKIKYSKLISDIENKIPELKVEYIGENEKDNGKTLYIDTKLLENIDSTLYVCSELAVKEETNIKNEGITSILITVYNNNKAQGLVAFELENGKYKAVLNTVK